MEVKCSLNLETPPFVSGALLTQAVKLGAITLSGGLNRGHWGGGGAHTEATEAIVMPLFLSNKKRTKTLGTSRHPCGHRTDCFSRSALSPRNPPIRAG